MRLARRSSARSLTGSSQRSTALRICRIAVITAPCKSDRAPSCNARFDGRVRGIGPMRVLAHVHTLNDEAVIAQVLDGLQRQTRPPDAIILVDNGSTDATLERAFPDGITVVRNGKNLGTSGAIHIGFAHALEHQFDWTWVFDADSVPEPQSLENLLAFFERMSPVKREQVCFLACRLLNAEGEIRHEPMMFTET